MHVRANYVVIMDAGLSVGSATRLPYAPSLCPFCSIDFALGTDKRYLG